MLRRSLWKKSETDFEELGETLGRFSTTFPPFVSAPASFSACLLKLIPGILCFSTKSAFSTLPRYLSTLSPLLHFSICSPIKASLIQRIWAPDWQLIFLLNTLFLLSAKTKFQPLQPLPILEVYFVIQRKGEGIDLEQFKTKRLSWPMILEMWAEKTLICGNQFPQRNDCKNLMILTWLGSD